jgi:translation initiation factor 5B
MSKEQEQTEKTEPKLVRSPIFAILGHVDSGKTSLLDKVRGTAVQAREAGGITQHIGASFFPVETIHAMCGTLMEKMKIPPLKIPGVLFIDTPGHAAFMNLRTRGASAANLAILVIDVIRGIQPQTIESIRILQSSKVPFVVAANKVDRIKRWKSQDPSLPMVESLKKQNKEAMEFLDNAIYDMMNEFARFNLEVDRFDRVKDLRKKVIVIPTSATTGEGIPELFLYLSGLTQRYLTERIVLDADKPGIGVVLEVKEQTGLGVTIDVLLTDGYITKNDEILVGSLEGPIRTHVKALLQPKDLDEIRDPRERFNSLTQITAAAGMKITAPNLDDVVAGSPIFVIRSEDNYEKGCTEIQTLMSSLHIETDQAGVIVKADALGSLEALVKFLRDNGVAIRFASVGPITKRDITEASIAMQEKTVYGAILSFNAPVLADAREFADKEKVKVFKNDIIYRLFEEYDEWAYQITEDERAKTLDGIIRPAKITILPYVFRRNNPAVVGVAIKAGVLTTKVRLIKNDGKRIGELQQIRHENDSLKEARMGQEVAISIAGPTVGRQINEGDDLYVEIPESHARKLLEHRDLVSGSELNALEELIDIKRRSSGNKYWAM